jgi:hypothetical protein
MQGRMGRERRGTNMYLSVCHSLENNHIRDKGCKALAAVLQTNITLTNLE